MRFYLTYKDHGLYDPVVDDTEVIYIPVDPVELGIVNIQTNIHEAQQKIETSDIKQAGEPPALVPTVEEFIADPVFEDLPLLINIDEIPPEGKFRLPVSENYDPEGNRVRVTKDNKKAVVTFNVKKILDEANEERIRLQEAQNAVSEYISESKINQNIKDDLLQTDKEIDEDYIRNKAIEVVSESVDKAISVANEINENEKNEFRTSDDVAESIKKELSKSAELRSQSVNIQKESINNVNVSEEVKKIEKIHTYNTESNVNERKLFTKQEIDETIQSGTVSRTSQMFNNENIEISKPYSIEINKNHDSIHTKRDESSYSDSGAKQRAFSIGLQTIPHIRENLSSLQIDYRLNLLTTFFLQLTNIMVTLSRFIATEPKIYLAKDSYTQKQEQRRFEKKEEKTTLDKRNEQTFETFDQHQEGQGLSKYKYEHVSNDSEGQLIRKGKLSGAKIAQIEGRKTTELTDKMDTVISEFQKKTGFEEQAHDQFFRSRSGSRSKMKNDETQTGKFYSETRKDSHTDRRTTYEEFSETKVQSLDIREMRSEKRSTEFKNSTTEVKSDAYESTTTDAKNLTYVAIVEAHVYTNKDAIFEEQMKREREIKIQDTEKTRIDTNQDIRKLSLADTIIIQPTEEITVNVIEDKEIELKKGITNIEQTTIKIAAKKISEVLEPLLYITSDRLNSVKQAHTIEEPFKSVVQSTDISTEEFEQYFVATTAVSQKIYPSLEKPNKSVVEITEIIADENERQVQDVLKLNVVKPKSIIEDAKSIAEKTEISIKEDELAVLCESKPHLEKPRQVVESMVKSVAKTTEVVTGSNIEMLVTPEKLVKTPHTTIEGSFKTTAETLTILPEESKSDLVEDTKMKQESAKVSITEKTEISIKEDELAVLFESKPYLEKPRQIVESIIKSVAETSEVVTGSNIEMLVIPEKIVNTPHTAIEGSFKTTAETLTILPEESKNDFIEDTKFKQESAKMTITEQMDISIKEDELAVLYESKPYLEKPRQIVESIVKSVAETSEVVTGINIEMLVTPGKIVNTPHTAIEGSFKTTAETLTILPEESKNDFVDNTEMKQEAAKMTITEKTDIIITEDELAVLFESKPYLEKPQQVLESMVKSVAETTEVVTGINIEMLVTPEKLVNTPHTAIEGSFKTTAETLTILPEESKIDFIEDSKMKQEAAKMTITEKTDMTIKEDELAVLFESKPHLEKPQPALESMVKSVAETTEVVTGSNIEMLVIPQKRVETSRTATVGAFKATAETLTVLPEECQSDIIETTKIKQEVANVLIGEKMSTEVFEVSLIDEREESLNVKKINMEQQPTLLLEESVFSVAQKSTISPVEPKSDIENFTKVEEKANIKFDELKAIENTIINLEEPGNNIFDTPETIKKYPLTSMEYPHLSIAEVFTILPDESKNNVLELPKIRECKSSIDFVQIEAAETRIIHPEEPNYEQLEVLRIEEKIPETTFVAPSLKLAEIISMQPEEPKDEFYIPESKNQQAGIKLIEFKAAEATIVEAEEFKQPDLNIEPLKEKRLKQIIEPSSLSVAEVFATTMTESSKFIPTEKIKIQVADIGVQELKAIETTEVALGDLTYNKITIHLPDTKQLKTSVEDSVQSVAQVTEVHLTDEVNKMSITSPLITKSKATAAIEKIKTTEIVKSEEVGRSISPTSPLSPITPVVEEYMFSLEAELEHPYVVKEAVTEEASLKIKTQKKEMQSVDTSYTLAIESIVERDSETIEEVEEIENLHLSKEVHESMLGVYETRQSNMSTNIGIKSVEANQVMSTGARNLDAHHKLSLKNLTLKQDASNIATLEANQNISTAVNLDASYKLSLDKTAMMEEESNSSQASHISQSSLHKSRKVKSSESQYSAIQEQEASVTSMQSGSFGTVIKAGASQYAESFDKIAVVQGESMSSRGSSVAQASLHNKTKKVKISESAVQKQESSMKSMQSGSFGATVKSGALQYTEASKEELSLSASKCMESTVLEGDMGFETHQHCRTTGGSYKEEASSSVESKSFATNESISQLSTQVIRDKSTASLANEKLILRTDLKNTISNGGQSSSPIVPPTPLTDEYMFRLQTELPGESNFIPRDCSISPESIHEDVVVNGLLTKYKTKIEERILYSPPLPTPSTSPEKTKSIYKKPGLKGGSDRLELTKEEIHDSTLVSAIDKTLKQIEDYKASVGLTSEEMSYQEDVDKEFIPIHKVEEWFDNEAVHDKAQNSQVEEVDSIKITIVTEENDTGETAITVTAEDNVNNGHDLEIQEILSDSNEVPLEGVEYDEIILNEQISNENKLDDFKSIQTKSDENLEEIEEDYELVAVHPSSLSSIDAGHGCVTTNKLDSEVLNVSARGVQSVTTDVSQELVMLHDQQIIGEEPIVPPVDTLKNSEVIKLLNEERTAVEERKWTTFLQKRYTPTPKTEVVYYGDFDFKTQFIPDAYKVKIVKQPKPKIAPDWKAEELKKEASPIIEITEPEATEETEIQEDNIIKEDKIVKDKTDAEILEELIVKETEELDLEEMAQRNLAEELIKNVENMIDINAPTEQQLEQMRDQLAALAQLPAVIQQTVELVNKRINLISQKEQQKKKEEEEHRRQEEEKRAELERTKQSLEMRVTKTEEELAIIKKEEVKRILETKIREEKQKKEKMERMKIDQESRQVTQRSTPRMGQPMPSFGPLQERPVILPGGRKWRTPEDVYDEELINETLVGQAEVIKGTAIGVNFMKFEKPPPPLDHLKHSEVFKAIHDIEQPLKKVELLGPVLSEADYRERARSMSPCVEKVAESTRTKQLQP